jgi:hypothetical protein
MEVHSISNRDLLAPSAQTPPRNPRPQGEQANGLQAEDAPNRPFAGPQLKDEEPAARQGRLEIEIPGAERAGTRMHVDEATERIVAQIVGRKNEVIKQIPPEELLRILAKSIDYYGLVFDVMI